MRNLLIRFPKISSDLLETVQRTATRVTVELEYLFQEKKAETPESIYSGDEKAEKGSYQHL